jgi:hypothetical protein
VYVLQEIFGVHVCGQYHSTYWELRLEVTDAGKTLVRQPGRHAEQGVAEVICGCEFFRLLGYYAAQGRLKSLFLDIFTLVD